MEEKKIEEEVVEKTQEEIDAINKFCDNIKVEVEPETPKERFEYLLEDFCSKIKENIDYIDTQLSAQKKIIDFIEDYIKTHPMQADAIAMNDELKQKLILVEKLQEARNVEQARYKLYKTGFKDNLVNNYDFVSTLNVFFKDAIGLDDYNDKIKELCENGKEV